MIRRAFSGLLAGLIGMMAGAGLPLAVDERSARRIAGVVRKVRLNKPRGPAGTRRHRRQYLPSSSFRKPCKFVYARGNAGRDARLRVITNNDRIENAVQAHRLKRKGLAA